MRSVIFATLVAVVLGFGPVPRAVRKSTRPSVSTLKAGIDVSGLGFVPIAPEDMQSLSVLADQSSPSLNDIQNALIIVAGLTYFVYETRPRGSARDDLIDVRKSSIPKANLGVFAKKYIPSGTIIGRFPGFVKLMEDALASSTYAMNWNHAKHLFASILTFRLWYSTYFARVTLRSLFFSSFPFHFVYNINYLFIINCIFKCKNGNLSIT
jgi:hypothetical protein